jgi:hypothetical protein
MIVIGLSRTVGLVACRKYWSIFIGGALYRWVRQNLDRYVKIRNAGGQPGPLEQPPISLRTCDATLAGSPQWAGSTNVLSLGIRTSPRESTAKVRLYRIAGLRFALAHRTPGDHDLPLPDCSSLLFDFSP